MGTVILLRHGESTWNAEGLFTGWVDVPLSPTGAKEATAAGQLLADAGAQPDVLYTSMLTRSIQTANLALEAAGWLWLPVRRSWRLNERHYALLGTAASPRTECLKDVVKRLMPYWQDVILGSVAVGQTVLVVAHGNSLRALVKHLDGISDADIAGLNIPTGIPLVYDLDDQFRPTVPGGRYLDPEAAKVAAAAVAQQGR